MLQWHSVLVSNFFVTKQIVLLFFSTEKLPEKTALFLAADRDSMQQERVHAGELKRIIGELVGWNGLLEKPV